MDAGCSNAGATIPALNAGATIRSSHATHLLCQGADAPLLFVFGLRFVQGRAKDIPERRAAVGRAELSDGFLFFRDLKGFDRKADLPAALVDLGGNRIDHVAGSEAFGTLFAAVA